jgi:hypothetical protein
MFSRFRLTRLLQRLFCLCCLVVAVVDVATLAISVNGAHAVDVSLRLQGTTPTDENQAGE